MQLTPATVRKICELIEKGVPQGAAAGSLGIPRSTFQKWLGFGRQEDGPEPYRGLALRIDESLDRFHASRAVVVGNATDPRTTLEVLTRRFPNDWQDPRQMSQVNVSVTLEVERRDLAERMMQAAANVLGNEPELLERFLVELGQGQVIEGEAIEVAEIAA